MQQRLTFTADETAVWSWLASRGIANALSGLSRMVGQELRVYSLDLEHLPARDAVALLGGPSKTIVGIYLTIDGDAAGHLLLVYEPEIVYQLADMQMGRPPETTATLGEVELPVMVEMGNITGSLFVNTLAEVTNLTLLPSPPAVMVDTAASILAVTMNKGTPEHDGVLAAKVAFGTHTQQVTGNFLVVPTADFLRAILDNSRIH